MLAITKNKGFTLVELAISLLIVGLLLAGILGPISTRIEQKNRQGTQDQLNDAKEALLGFALTEGRLPCPDCPSITVGSCSTVPTAPDELITINDGIEDRLRDSTTQEYYCATDRITGNYYTGGSNYYSIGNLPFATLGVAEFDAWKTHFTYAVTSDFADELDGANYTSPTPPAGAPVRPNPCSTAGVGISFELCSGGNLNIQTVDETDTTRPIIPVPLVNDVPALVFSGTKTDFTDQAVPSPLEAENTDNDNVFIYTNYRKETNNEFDDLMIWISPNILKNRMVQAGRLP